MRITVFGDSLVAGYGLPLQEAFPAQLQQHLQKQGFNVEVFNAGISGNTTAAGRARMERILDSKPDLVIVVLGGNDMLRGIPVAVIEQNLDAILSFLKRHHLHVFLAGMKAPASLGASYQQAFDNLYPALAKKYNTGLYPFFLEKVYSNPDLMMEDGVHPRESGIKVIVEDMLPYVANMMKGKAM